MCGIAGLISISAAPIRSVPAKLNVMSHLIAHRGPDGDGAWVSKSEAVGFAHRRLAIIDPTPDGAQPMHAPNGTVIVFNGEIYNFVELREELKGHWTFRTRSDTEVILAAYDRWGVDFLDHLRGMFAFALWDERRQRLVAARDRFGIKPFYYTLVDEVLYFGSEAKALLLFLPKITTDSDALAEYLTFQYTIGEKTLFRDVHQLLPAHVLLVENKQIVVRRYWDVHYEVDWDHSPPYFENQLRELLADSMSVHLRSDVPIGAYISGGIDSSLMAILAAKADPQNRHGFHGRFTDYPGYDESKLCAARRRPVGDDVAYTGHHRRRLPGSHPRPDMAHGFSGGRARIVPAVHGVRAGRQARQGGSRRAGWR